MKIKRRSIEEKTSTPNTPVVSNTVSTSKYQKCLKYIRSAINCLTDSDTIDDDDRECIANLGVVALDVSSKEKERCQC